MHKNQRGREKIPSSSSTIGRESVGLKQTGRRRNFEGKRRDVGKENSRMAPKTRPSARGMMVIRLSAKEGQKKAEGAKKKKTAPFGDTKKEEPRVGGSKEGKFLTRKSCMPVKRPIRCQSERESGSRRKIAGKKNTLGSRERKLAQNTNAYFHFPIGGEIGKSEGKG